MSPTDQQPHTPRRNNAAGSALSQERRRLLSSSGRTLPRRVVLPASAPPSTPRTTDRVRRLTFDPTNPDAQRTHVSPTLPRNVPLAPAAMRHFPVPATQASSTPRRRVVPNVIPEDEPAQTVQTETYPIATRNNEPIQPALPSIARVKFPSTAKAVNEVTIAADPNKDTTNNDNIQDAPRATQADLFTSPYKPTPIGTGTPNAITTITGPPKTYPNIPIFARAPRSIPGTSLNSYTATQQRADYHANLLSDSLPESTWQSRRGAPMVPSCRAWLEADLYSHSWFHAVVLSYRMDAARGEELGGTEEEKREEMEAKARGHLAGVSVEREVERYVFEARLLERARELVLWDCGVAGRGALRGK